ncbi:hypothetical protein [Ktedonobacter racemifer]|nr:hypothetical protein [Ktedonobacter racemifer]
MEAKSYLPPAEWFMRFMARWVWQMIRVNRVARLLLSSTILLVGALAD